MKKRIKLNGLVLLLALLPCIWFPRLLVRSGEGFLDDFSEVIGYGLILLGLLLRTSARGYKAENSGNGNALVTGGPYSMVRNPMYLGIILAGTGVILAIGQWWALLVFGGGFLLRYLYLFRTEERLLEKVFGAKYLAYKQEVPRLLPRPGPFFRRNVREFLPLKAEWFRAEMISIVPVVGSVVAVELWEEFSRGGWMDVLHSLLLLCAVYIAFTALKVYLTGSDEKG